MRYRPVVAILAIATVAACGVEEGVPDTSFEKRASAPVPTDVAPGEPVPDNDVGTEGDDPVIDGQGGQPPEAETPTTDVMDTGEN